MKLMKKALFTFMSLVFSVNLFAFVSAAGSPYDAVLDTTIDGESLESAISDSADFAQGKTGGDLVNEQVKLLIGYAINIFIVIGIAIAFFGGYKIMTSNSEDKMKEGIRLVVFGILGVIIMVSAKFLAEGLVGNDGIISVEFGNTGENPSGIELAKNLYEKIMYPFIKVALYLVVGALFFIMAAKVLTFVISTEEAAKKKAGGIILWCVIGILIVMGSKQIVESVMGKQEKVLNENATSITAEAGNTSGMGNEITKFESIPLIAQVINRVMGLAMFVILVLIIIQGYRMFTKPDDPKNRERLKKTMLYVIIGVLVIGASYVISNILVLNGFNSVQG